MNNSVITSSDVIQHLQELTTIRKQAQRMLALGRQNRLPHFSIHEDKLTDTAAFVLEVIHANYPTLEIPYHTRWRHFEAGGINRMHDLHLQMAGLSRQERGRILFELVIISVFLDAGAGEHWRYVEAESGQTLSRSEGLGVASLNLYQTGIFSAHTCQDFRVDSEALLAFSHEDLIQGFQVSADNPLAGLDGRVALLNRLGASLASHTQYFGKDGRLGLFYDAVEALQQQGTLPARTLFQAVLTAFADVWPKRLQYDGIPLGDVWTHASLKTENPGSDYIPFHKLSQWLSYSLIEPLEQLGIRVTDMDELTGLAEYRNGGLFMDMGVLTLKDTAMSEQAQQPGSECIVEWRALTIALLDELATMIRKQLNLNAQELPLAKILQGGTWEAGRRIARQKR